MRAFNTIHQSMRQSIKYLALAASVAIVAACHGLPEKTDETALWNNKLLPCGRLCGRADMNKTAPFP